MKGSFSIVRQVFQRRFSTLRSSRPSALSSSAPSLIASPSSTPSQIPRNSLLPASTFVSSIASNFSTTCFLPSTRSLCSSAGGGNGVVIVKSEEEFINAMSKAEGGSSPSIFYFTAVWCGPCMLLLFFFGLCIDVFIASGFMSWLTSGRFIAPVIEELSKQYPDVTTYKIDIDEGGLSNTLSKLSITAVPTLQFFKEGSKKGEIVGADVAKLKNLMEQLYK
ncbi:thioredoxin O1, mitochondrial isoform X1 [Brassica rapa]|uniref:thioredoxin O1, mitochondrial isoform X1 n=1 Tax=Brassica campestris TaxID=3711 RepID=UPI00142E4879|nr:thioredoxin O1, mitochondrial isoform X1 [Brassica rapa]